MLRSRAKSLQLAGRRRGLLSDGFRGPRPGKVEQAGAITATSRAINIRSDVTTAHVKGVWSEFTSALTFDADGFYIGFNFMSARTRHFVDVGIGGSGSEVVLVPDIPMTASAQGTVGMCYIPIKVPGGSRVAVRNQSNAINSGIDVQLIFVASEALAAMSFRRATAYGHVHASTISACLPDPNNTADVKGTYDELVASTTNPMKAWSFYQTTQSQDFASNRTFLTDLAVGAAASEVVLLGDMDFQEHSTNDAIVPHCIGPIYVPVPAGSRLSCRAQSDTASDSDFSYCYVLGFD